MYLENLARICKNLEEERNNGQGNQEKKEIRDPASVAQERENG
jgi:hypothetical protein